MELICANLINLCTNEFQFILLWDFFIPLRYSILSSFMVNNVDKTTWKPDLLCFFVSLFILLFEISALFSDLVHLCHCMNTLFLNYSSKLTTKILRWAGPNLESKGSIRYWPERALFDKKGHQKLHHPTFNPFSKCFASI